MQAFGPPIFHLAPQYVLAVGRTAPDGLKLLGSAFLVAPGKLVTTRHVTGGDETNLGVLAPRIGSLLDYEDTSNTSVSFANARITEVDTLRDICLLEISGSGAPPYRISTAGDVAPGDSVVTFGFPHSDTGRFVLTRQDTHVSGFNSGINTATGAGYAFVWLSYSPTADERNTFFNRLNVDVTTGYPVAGDAWEVAGYDHLNNHPINQTIFHWFQIGGYGSYGGSAYYQDSATTVWSGVQPNNWIDMQKMIGILGGRGYEW